MSLPRSYEAFVIYTFLNLCLGYVGGAGEVEVKMNGFVLQPSVLACTCCLPPQVRRAEQRNSAALRYATCWCSPVQYHSACCIGPQGCHLPCTMS